MRILSTVKIWLAGAGGRDWKSKFEARRKFQSGQRRGAAYAAVQCVRGGRDSTSWLCHHPMREIYLDEAKQLGEKTFRPQRLQTQLS